MKNCLSDEKMFHILSLPKVKKRLATSSYSENIIFLRFFIIFFTCSVFSFFDTYFFVEDGWSQTFYTLYSFVQIVLSSVGLFFCYVANKGNRGKNFLEVFCSIAVAWGLRVFFIALALSFVSLVIPELLISRTAILEVFENAEKILDEISTMVFEVLIQLIFWIGMILHIRDVSRFRLDSNRIYLCKLDLY